MVYLVALHVPRCVSLEPTLGVTPQHDTDNLKCCSYRVQFLFDVPCVTVLCTASVPFRSVRALVLDADHLPEGKPSDADQRQMHLHGMRLDEAGHPLGGWEASSVVLLRCRSRSVEPTRLSDEIRQWRTPAVLFNTASTSANCTEPLTQSRGFIFDFVLHHRSVVLMPLAGKGGAWACDLELKYCGRSKLADKKVQEYPICRKAARKSV